MSTKATISIWHNPRCSKSRQTLQLLRNQGFEPEIVEYLNNPPTAEEISRVLDMLGIEPEKLIRKGEKIFKELELAGESDPQTLIVAMHHNPILIERPVVIANDKAALGRPPENVLDILKG